MQFYNVLHLYILIRIKSSYAPTSTRTHPRLLVGHHRDTVPPKIEVVTPTPSTIHKHSWTFKASIPAGAAPVLDR